MSPQPASATVTHSKTGAAQRRRFGLVSLRCNLIVTVVIRPGPPPGSDSTESDSGAILPFEHDLCGKPVSTFPDHASILSHYFELSHAKQLDSRAATLLNPAADANTSVFERPKVDSRSLE